MKYLNHIDYVNIKSSPRVSAFAPEWSYILGESMIQNIDFNKVKNFCIEKEKEILELPITYKENRYSDGHTKLGTDSVTARYGSYNFLLYNEKEVQKIKTVIIDLHSKFVNGLQVKKPKSLFVQCWVNIMRKGEKIHPHIHHIKSDSYLSGHICVQCDNTSTHYINPVNQINNPEIYSSKNEIGKITLFQSCIPHYTDIVKKDTRITIAFDLLLNDNYINDNIIKLY